MGDINSFLMGNRYLNSNTNCEGFKIGINPESAQQLSKC